MVYFKGLGHVVNGQLVAPSNSNHSNFAAGFNGFSYHGYSNVSNLLDQVNPAGNVQPGSFTNQLMAGNQVNNQVNNAFNPVGNLDQLQPAAVASLLNGNVVAQPGIPQQQVDMAHQTIHPVLFPLPPAPANPALGPPPAINAQMNWNQTYVQNGLAPQQLANWTSPFVPGGGNAPIQRSGVMADTNGGLSLYEFANTQYSSDGFDHDQDIIDMSRPSGSAHPGRDRVPEDTVGMQRVFEVPASHIRQVPPMNVHVINQPNPGNPNAVLMVPGMAIQPPAPPPFVPVPVANPANPIPGVAVNAGVAAQVPAQVPAQAQAPAAVAVVAGPILAQLQAPAQAVAATTEDSDSDVDSDVEMADADSEDVPAITFTLEASEAVEPPRSPTRARAVSSPIPRTCKKSHTYGALKADAPKPAKRAASLSCSAASAPDIVIDLDFKAGILGTVDGPRIVTL